jgi:hypothetical protein
MHRRFLTRRRLRGIGVVALAIGVLLLAAFAFARLAPAAYHRADDLTGGAFNAIVGLVGVVTGLLGVARGRPAPGTEDEQLATGVALLADALRLAATARPQGQQHDDFQPLRVSWSTTDGAATADLAAVLGRPATDLPRSTPGGCLAGPRSESWQAVVTVALDLCDAHGRRLLIMGGAGAGKTVLAEHVAEEANRRLAAPGAGPARVMVPLSVAGWDPGEERVGAAALLEWIAGRLIEQHHHLGVPVASAVARDGSEVECSVAYRLLRTGRLIPILDGLDEIPMPLRSEAIAKINELVPEGLCMVVTTREQEYWTAVRAPRDGAGGAPTGVLTCAAVACLLPFSVDDVRAYLDLRTAVVAGERPALWEPVHAALAADPPGPLTAVLTKPLMAWLAASVYAGQGDPGEMPALAERGRLEAHLLERFVPAAFRRDPRWRPDRARGWLAFLATDLRARHEQRLAWWRVGESHRRAVGVLVGIATGLATLLAVGPSVGFGLRNGAGAGTAVSLAAGALTGTALGIGIGIACARRTLPPTNLEFRVRRQFWEALLGGLVVGGVTALIFGAIVGAGNGLLVGALLGVPVALGYGAFGQARDTASPAALLRRDRWFVVAFLLAYGIPGGIIASVYFGGPAVGVPLGLAVGFTGGTINGVQYAVVKRWDQFGVVAWFRFVVVRAYFAARGDLPWRLMTFLTDAHRRGVLRQDGGYWQFRHVQLRDQLAAGGAEEPDRSATADDVTDRPADQRPTRSG